MARPSSTTHPRQQEGSMADVPITIACGNYDRTAAIRDGRVKVDGCAVTYLPLYPEEIFHRAFKFDEFDVSELSFSSYLRTTTAGTSPYIGIPAFLHLHPHRCRHPHARGSTWQAHRLAGISDHGGGLDARHAAARIWRQAQRDPLAQRRAGGARPRRAHAAQVYTGARPQAARAWRDAGRYAAQRRA